MTTIKSAFALLALLAATTQANAQTVEFTLVNESAQVLTYFYTSPSEEEEWGDDLLGEDGVLEPGVSGTVTIGDGSDQCLYDFRFETSEGVVLEVDAIDICALATYTLTD
ncbi:MAG TPA: hypothetical protein VLZ53_07170 [Devosia sp.]|nr:hypothetical protein [Devosia sp.]